MARQNETERYEFSDAEARGLIKLKVIDIFGNDTMTLVPVTVG